MAAKKKSLLNGVLYFFNIIAAISLLISYLAYYISPEITSFFAFFGLAYPSLLLANVLFIFYWLIRLKKHIFLSIVCVAIGYFHIGRLYQLNGQKMVLSDDDALKVMTYNIRHFGHKGGNPEENKYDAIKNLVSNENPDVLIIQEYNSNRNPDGFRFPYVYGKTQGGKRLLGPVIFSKYPISGNGTLSFNHDDKFHNSEFIYADIRFKNQIIRVFNIHLASIGFEDQDYNRLAHPEQGNSEEMKRDFANIYKRLKVAFNSRALQIEAVETAIENSPHPVILAGDFNDTPQSFTYHRIDLLLDDSFMGSGQGFDRTYANGPAPLRIDYIFHSPEFTPYNFKSIDKEYSDHYANVVEFLLKTAPAEN